MGNDGIKSEQIDIHPSVSSLLDFLLWRTNTGEFWADELQTDRLKTEGEQGNEEKGPNTGRQHAKRSIFKLGV